MHISQAIQFLEDEVDLPALNHPLLEKEYKNKVTRSKIIINRVKKIGDLARYLKRFETVPPVGDDKRKLYDRFKELGLKAYEDLYPEFVAKFGPYLDDVTVLDDFVLGRAYSSWDISIYSQTYDTQSGIYLIGNEPNYQAIFIKATFEDGKYPNEWLGSYDVLKYYMFSLKGNFKTDYKYNTAIINSANLNVPIYVFEKQNEQCHLKGIYRYSKDEMDPTDGSRWFILNKIDSLSTDKVVTQKEYEQEVSKHVQTSRIRNKAERRTRLHSAPKIPSTVVVTSNQFVRNADVIVEVLERSKGICEECRKPAPFLRRDLTPYLEVHHKKPLAEGGEDTVDNAVALCPNCHRAAHHAADVITVTAAIIQTDDQILIARRGGDDDLAGKWEFPGGKVEGRESLEQCLRREIKEELGVNIRVQRYFGESVVQGSNGTYRIMAFMAKLISGDPEPTEHSELRWVTASELDQYTFLSADEIFVDLLKRLAEKKKNKQPVPSN
ncbi:NUDIX domain-containing protein [Paenibacillus sp. strain BS8-2]